MKKILLAMISLALPAVMFSQTAFADYQDGKIWFRVNDDVRLDMSLNDDPHDLPISAVPFLNTIKNGHQFTHLSRPFFAAKNSSILQRTFLLEFSDFTNVNQIIEAMRQTGKVVYAEKVPLDHECIVPNDPSYGSQWHLATVNAASAWNFFSTGSTIRIAIVDNAVDRAHQDLSGNLWVNAGEIASNGIDDDGDGYIDDINGYDVADNDNNPNPPNNTFDHGTHCAGIADAKTNNAIGIAGMGYSLKLMAVKATANSASASSVTNGYDGVVYAVSAGADVISMSWGGSSSSTTAQNIITWASQQGCILVAAAGNNNTNTMFYPAGYTECIAVAATNSNDTKASFSNYGSWVDISAPGNNIFSTLPSNQYGNMSGTSMACPLVAGLCGLMLSLNPSLTPTDVRNCLSSSAVNINAMNSSYIGQLGAGRIDANAAMSCISSTLSWPPNALFTANVTTVTAGGSVNFTDQSVYNPTTWSWTFSGGTPASYVGQNPPAITYSTPGTYNVSLTVTNANGTDTQTNTNYITVTAASGCTKVNLPAPAGWTPVNYYTGSSVGQNGWINGVNINAEKQKAMYFDESTQPYTILNNVWVAFGLAYTTNQAKIVPCHIYDGTSGTPGTLLGTVNTTMGQIMSDVAGNYYTEFSFVNSPVTLPASKKIFVSIDLTNLNWATSHDTLSIVSNTNGQTTAPIPIWEQQSNNSWHQYTTAGSWNLSASLYIHPFLTDANSVATIAASPLTLCAGNAVSFDATGSTYEDTLLWYFPGGSPVTSNNIIQQTLYQNAGNYQGILYIIGGGCHLFDSAFVNITVNANPTIAVTLNPSTSTVCSGTPVTMSATGASTYAWSPSTYLSATTGSSVTSTPTASIAYNLQGTGANGCVSNTTINIDVDDPPTAAITESATNVCPGQPVVFDGSGSSSATGFSWTFTGGNPASSSASSATVTYSTVGTYTATLTVTNACGTNTISSQTINVGCMGIDPVAITDPTAFYNSEMQQVEIQLPSSNDGYTVCIYDNLGQMVKGVSTKNTKENLSASDLAAGVYTVTMTNANGVHSMKFVK
ncbi:MAG TPA: S8 family serine peptidase [Bacteroidia bacterium]|jgi:subtilisin family serine protease|nr:S8 family serine peptidase [Bacteroidia bacterium]